MAMNGSPLFLFNGSAIPDNPQAGYLEESEQLVEGTRNAKGRTVAQPINRRINKFSDIVFPMLTLAQVKWLKQKVANFKVDLTYYDSEEDKIVTRKFYFGDLSAQPFKWDTNHATVAKPTHYKNVKINIIDMGY